MASWSSIDYHLERVEETPSIEQQRLLLDRILSSTLFRKSHRLASFLRFICEEQQQGRGHTIQEQRIGTVVFGRPESYHMGEDSIVRSQARFLRLRLEEYFATEGKDESIVLTVPKGSYVPGVSFPGTVWPACTFCLGSVRRGACGCVYAA